MRVFFLALFFTIFVLGFAQAGKICDKCVSGCEKVGQKFPEVGEKCVKACKQTACAIGLADEEEEVKPVRKFYGRKNKPSFKFTARPQWRRSVTLAKRASEFLADQKNQLNLGLDNRNGVSGSYTHTNNNWSAGANGGYGPNGGTLGANANYNGKNWSAGVQGSTSTKGNHQVGANFSVKW
jgi:hypothetical protein